jgi:hypothetical protein
MQQAPAAVRLYNKFIAGDHKKHRITKRLSKRWGIIIKVTPAMAASVTSKLWELSDMVKVLEDWELKRGKG